MTTATTATTSPTIARARRMCVDGTARAIRVGAGLSLRDVARDVGATPVAVLRWERGEQRPRGDLAVRYVQVLDDVARVIEGHDR